MISVSGQASSDKVPGANAASAVTDERPPTTLHTAGRSATSLPTAGKVATRTNMRWSELVVPGIVATCVSSTIVMLVWWLLGLVKLALLTRSASAASPVDCESLRSLGSQYKRRVTLLRHEQVTSPISFHLLRPVIILPGQVYDVQQLRWALKHELTHIERGDWWSWQLAQLVRAIWVWQPLAWVLRHQLRVNQDFVADAYAVADTSSPASYATFLTDLARSNAQTPANGLAMAPRKSDLYRRVVMLVDPHRHFHLDLPRSKSLAAIALAIVVCWGIGSITLQHSLQAAAPRENLKSAEPERPSAASESLLPAHTFAFAQFADLATLEAAVSKTQLGAILQDRAMAPFEDSLSEQIDQQLRRRFGIRLNEARQLARRGLSVAVVPSFSGHHDTATVLIFNVAGREAQARKKVRRITSRLVDQDCHRWTYRIENTEIQQLNRAATEATTALESCFFFKSGYLIVTQRAEVAKQIARLAVHEADATLAGSAAFRLAMDRTQVRPGKPHVRWFVNPLKLPVDRTLLHERWTLRQLAEYGYAIDGIAGQVVFSAPLADIEHRMFVCCTGDQSEAATKTLPNGRDFLPPDWVTADCQSYLACNLKLQSAFEFLGHTWSRLNGDGRTGDLLEEVLDALKHDPDGPQVDIRRDIVAHLGERVTRVAGSHGESQHTMWALELTDSRPVAAAIDKAMGMDPDYCLHEVAGERVWIRLSSQGTQAICVAKDHLLFASHRKMILDVLLQDPASTALAKVPEVARVNAKLRAFADRDRAATCVARSRSIPAIYERVRAGNVAPILQWTLAGLDFQKLPGADQIKRHVGVSGFTVQMAPDGWSISSLHYK